MTLPFDPCYLDSFLARITPFEAWVVRQRHGLYDVNEMPRDPRSADDIGADCGLEASRIVEIEGRAITKMLAMMTTLAAD